MSEATEHEALFDFLSRMEGRYPDVKWAFHTPNGEKRDKATAAKLKRMGVRAGVPDVLMPIMNAAPIGGEFFVGLAIELKVGRNTVSDEQAAWLECLQLNGWATYICYDWVDAARILIRWVGGNPDDVEGL